MDSESIVLVKSLEKARDAISAAVEVETGVDADVSDAEAIEKAVDLTDKYITDMYLGGDK